MTATQAEPAYEHHRVGGEHRSDEMHDSEEDLRLVEQWPPLHRALTTIAQRIVEPFDAVDARAIRQQHRYHWVIRFTAVSGGVAVLSTLAELTAQQLGQASLRAAFARIELLALAVSLCVVILGWFLAWLESWLLDRFKAEQLRLLKFRALLDPRLWTPAGFDAWCAELVTARDRTLSLDRDALRVEAELGLLPQLPTRQECAHLEPGAVEALLDYYGRKRIDGQRRYFERAARRGQHWLDNPKLLKWFFASSVIFVALHAGVEYAAGRGGPEASGPLATVAVLLVALSAASPIVWAAIRTYRSAREFSRNVARSESRRQMLAQLGARVEHATGQDAEHVLSQLQMCELVLESDQREWLRLMREVEWYG